MTLWGVDMEKAVFRPFSIVVRGRLVEFHRPAVMGILNITEDSFYDGGRHTSGAAMVEHARLLAAEGADIIDVGAASSRPGAELLAPEEEGRRLSEAVRLLRSELPEAIVSVDTCYSLAARAAVEAGADMVNDIGGGGLDGAMFCTVAELQVPYVMMHMRGTPQTMGQMTDYDDVVDELVRYFSERLDRLYRMGVKDVWIDPGFGFAKTVEQNYELLDRLGELTELLREPVLVGMSRKSMIYKRLGCGPEEALTGTIALDAIALDRGARVVRVHDVRPAKETINLLYPEQ